MFAATRPPGVAASPACRRNVIVATHAGGRMPGTRRNAAMRLALVTETYPPEVNGVALTMEHLATGLRRSGSRVEVVRPSRPGEDPRQTTEDELPLPGASLPSYPGLRFGWPAGRLLRKRWCAQRPDAVYIATEGPLGWSAMRVARALGIPVVSGFHTRFDHYLGRYGIGGLAFAWMRYFHNRADATVVATSELASTLPQQGFSRVVQLSRAVDTHAFDPIYRNTELRASWNADDSDPVIIHVGRVAPEKNLWLAARAFRQIQATQPMARFVFVGDGPERAALEAANPDFIFTGTLRGRELSEHFASADLFLFPSLSETFGNVTLEAMASGVPTIAFNYGAAREYLRDGQHGRAITCGDSDGFIAAAAQLADDAATRMRMGTAARAAVASMEPSRVCADFAALLSGLSPRKKS